MNTTYEEVLKAFDGISKGIDAFYLPTSDEGQSNLINAARIIFNQKLFDEKSIRQDDIIEQFDRKLTELEVALLSECMLYVVLNNIVLEFSSLYGSSTSDIGVRSYKQQMDARINTRDYQMNRINDIVFSMSTYEDGDM